MSDTLTVHTDMPVRDEGNTGMTEFRFTITRANPTDEATLHYGVSSLLAWTGPGEISLSDGPYLRASDFAVTSDGQPFTGQGELHLSAGQAEDTVLVPIRGDRFAEPDETFRLNVAGSTADATIRNDDAGSRPMVSLQGPGRPVTEGDSFHVILSRAQVDEVSSVEVHFISVAGTRSVAGKGDFVGDISPRTVIFEPGETTKVVTYQIADDTRHERGEAFALALYDGLNATIGGPSVVEGSISDDDPLPEHSIFVSTAVVPEGDGNTGAVFHLSVNRAGGDLDQPTSVFLLVEPDASSPNTADPSDLANGFEAVALHFAPGETKKTLDVAVRGDGQLELDEAFTVRIAGAQGSGSTTGESAPIGKGWTTLTILNDDGVRQINGTNRNDVIDSTSVSPGVSGGPAASSADLIRSGGGKDQIRGGGGADVIYGDDGKDRLWGETGNDLLHGGGSKDEIRGGEDDDVVHGDGGKDRLWGEGGNDLLYGDDSKDQLHGGDGDDQFHGGSGKDELWGDAGADWLFGGSGDDIMTGGAGADTFALSEGDDSITDFSPGEDTVLASLPDGRYAPGEVFNLRSVYVADPGSVDLSAFGGAPPGSILDLRVFIRAYSGGQIVEEISTTVGNRVFHLGWRNIEKLVIESERFERHSGVLVTSAEVSDVRIASSEGDRIEVSTESDVAALIATATSDGAGGTALHYAGQTLTLRDLQPSALLADWFTFA
ncbi:Calx-beta domain-containing protein [Roseomonas chloroacetimidivorans]|uniref:Calx-beta domain-containing protein n=1 Tax=Roseomonas chloroacetimidivorans TaxID=1766656 RepID=UPI003C7153AA